MVELKSYFGDDNMVVDVARVSFDKLSSMYTAEQNNKLIGYLAKGGKDDNGTPHWSPFSHPQLQFSLTVPIYVERQLVKTEAGRVYNSISGRYVDFSDTYYEIETFRKQSIDSKQGSAEDLNPEDNGYAQFIQSYVITACKKAYSDLLDLGVSKEQARSVLPLSLNTTMIWTGSLYTLIRLCKQRLKPDAQKETRDVVQLMLDAVKSLEGNPFEHSLKAFDF